MKVIDRNCYSGEDGDDIDIGVIKPDFEASSFIRSGTSPATKCDNSSTNYLFPLWLKKFFNALFLAHLYPSSAFTLGLSY